MQYEILARLVAVLAGVFLLAWIVGGSITHVWGKPSREITQDDRAI